jgi:CheY-like chemotaxis protein
VDLPAFLAVVVDIVRVRAEEKSLLFRYEGANDLPRTVLVDEMRLRQILLNLLGNAVKFTDAGEVRLRAAVRPQGSRAMMRFEVWDTGIGMSPEAMQRLFQPFEQVSDVRHRSGGAGLGLSISQALARLMGGEVQVQSMPGKGSCFTFELELAVLDVMAPAPEAPRAVTGYSGPRKRVLIVDDIAANRSMLADTLQMLGFDTAQAEDGKQALEQANALCPDLIVMDVVMPEMDGMEATRRLRATRESGDRLPIIAVSASSSQGQAQECLAAGADAYLAKPLALPQLLERIGALLQLDWTH